MRWSVCFAITRMRCNSETRTCESRRTAEGKSHRDIRRCLKLTIALQLYRAAAAKEVVVAGEDSGSQCQRESYRSPVVRVAWDATQRNGFQVFVELARNDVDDSAVDECTDRACRLAA